MPDISQTQQFQYRNKDDEEVNSRADKYTQTSTSSLPSSNSHFPRIRSKRNPQANVESYQTYNQAWDRRDRVFLCGTYPYKYRVRGSNSEYSPCPPYARSSYE